MAGRAAARDGPCEDSRDDVTEARIGRADVAQGATERDGFPTARTEIRMGQSHACLLMPLL